MLKRCTSIFILIMGFILMVFSLAAEARTNVGLDISINATPPPPPTNTVVMMPPQGYSNCYMTQGMWLGNVWVPPHQECAYPGPSGASVWVSGYWGCMAVGPGGNCGRWKWYTHRWVRGPVARAYYGDRHAYHHRHW